MSFALIEVEALAKKAARGAGFSWGMAEEAARATRWLCMHGIDGVAVLERALEQTEGQSAPPQLEGDWQATSGMLCPLRTGAALSDSAALWCDAGKRILGVAAPALLLPFAAMAAQTLERTVTISWQGLRAVTDGTSMSLATKGAAALFDDARKITVSTGGTLAAAPPKAHRAKPDMAGWARLNALAHRTYAPDTEESRLKGAGAGLSDND